MQKLLKTAWLLCCSILSIWSSPFLFHADRFPQVPHADILVMLRFNADYQEHLGRVLNLYPHQTFIAEEIREAEQLRQAWDAFDDATREGPSVERKRAALKRLLNIIGPEAFAEGRLPCFVPIWRFQEVRQ